MISREDLFNGVINENLSISILWILMTIVSIEKMIKKEWQEDRGERPGLFIGNRYRRINYKTGHISLACSLEVIVNIWGSCQRP